jgi:hypothetical protein
MLGTMRLTGQMLSLGISLMIISIYLGNVQISPANYPQFLKSLPWHFSPFQRSVWFRDFRQPETRQCTEDLQYSRG